ncbi:E3 ubiquitin-protein ligase atl41 [Phtheirospermum japonicum]|uniref:RING-type E3 ubiquitin transferase n=1 Tax=Phtheirospermum japonicum TaxID=374723 RepID=A0A830B0H1_9LAMI|nr:E3 ubiquitin-protein ligase atl41 [Phtheirospermum japonicum]
MSSDDDDGWFSHREHNYDVNSRIMLIAIVSLSFVIIVVTVLHIYARCVLRRQARRQAALVRLDLITTSADLNAAEPPKTGLDPAVIAALPIFVFRQINNNGNNIDDQLMGPTECSVCLSMLEDGEMARALPNCKHTFHANCIDIWFGSNSTCPICRTEAQPRPVAEPREGVVGSPPSAPPIEATSSDRMQISGKINSTAGPSSSSRLSSFRRIILNRERSSRRMQNQSCGQGDGLPDPERQ